MSLSRTGTGWCIYHLLAWSNLNLLHISQWITLPTQSCLALYSFCANLLHSLIMWLIISSLSLHSLHLQLCCVLSILTLIWLVLMALTCAAVRRDSVSLLRFPFLSQVQVFWCEMLFLIFCYIQSFFVFFNCKLWVKEGSDSMYSYFCHLFWLIFSLTLIELS